MMVPPKYNFYVGKVDYDMRTHLHKSTSIDELGNFNYAANSGEYASYKIGIKTGEHLFFNLISTDSHNAIFFYDDTNFISSAALIGLNNTVIVPPSNAKYWAVRFTLADVNFERNRNTDFVYSVKSVVPHFKKISKKYSKESGQEFFRVSIDGKINLFGDAYEIVNQSSIEDQLIFIIDKYNKHSKKWIEYYKGRFNKTDCKFDHDKKKCELKTIALDDYSEIIDKYENTYDLIKLNPEISKINLCKRSLIQVYILGAKSITNLFGGTCWESDVNEVIDNSNTLINKYHFAYIKTGNEFYVKNAEISEVNDVYAGTNGRWHSSTGNYTLYFGTDIVGKKEYFYIKHNSDNAILYRSTRSWYFSTEDDCYAKDIEIEMANIDNPSDKFTIEPPFVYSIYKRLLCDVDTIEDAEGIKNTYDLPLDDFVTDNRNYKKCIGLGGGLLFCTSAATDEPTKYGLNDYGLYFTNRFIPSSLGLERPLPISRNSWVNASLWYVYSTEYLLFERRTRKQYTLKDSYSIGAAIKAIIKEINPTLSHEATAEYSQFLYGDTNPLDLHRFYVYITQKTNILKGNYDQPAQKAETSLKELMSMLRDCFRCYWYIEDGKFKIEHIYFFMNGRSYSGNLNYQLDFTKLVDPFNKKSLSYYQSEIDFEKSNLTARYEFAWMDDVTELFGNVAIDIVSNYVQKNKTEEISISQFSSDVDYMMLNPGNFSNDGFALLCPVKTDSGLELPIRAVENLIDENGNYYKAIAQNWYASWIYLQRMYMWDMPGAQIKFSSIDDVIDVKGIKRCMKHTISLFAEEDLTELNSIKTQFGVGEISEMTFDLDTRQATIDLLYEPR